MKILQEFKAFAMKGNVLDMAVGIIIGAAFGKIVTSLVADVIMPPIGFLLGGVDFQSLAITLKDPVMEGDVVKSPAVVIAYGKFISTVIDFVIVAFCIFMVVKLMNAARRKEEGPPPPPAIRDCPQCLEKVPVAAKRCRACTSPI